MGKSPGAEGNKVGSRDVERLDRTVKGQLRMAEVEKAMQHNSDRKVGEH